MSPYPSMAHRRISASKHWGWQLWPRAALVAVLPPGHTDDAPAIQRWAPSPVLCVVNRFHEKIQYIDIYNLSGQFTIIRTSWPRRSLVFVTFYLASLILLLGITGLFPSPNTSRWRSSYALDYGATKTPFRGWKVFSGWLVAVATLVSGPEGKKLLSLRKLFYFSHISLAPQHLH